MYTLCVRYVLPIVVLLGTTLIAQTPTPPAAPAENPQSFPEWLDGVRTEARARGIRQEIIDAAFADVAGITPGAAESEFWQRQRIWTNWLPILTSTTTLWMAVTLLAILAIYRRRRRNLEIAKQWEKDENRDGDL